jgi:menaquinone-specific isochorismate synthase
MQSGAIFSLDKEKVLIGFGAYRWLSEDHLNSQLPAFYLPDFFLKEKKPWLQFEKYQEMSIASLLQALPVHANEPNIYWEHLHQKQFSVAFEQLQHEFTTSPLQKAVPYAFMHSKNQLSLCQLQSSLQAALRYVKKNSHAYIYGFWNADEGMLGVTPELLFDYAPHASSSLSTMALAGTCAKNSCSIEFAHDAKQLQEHRLAVEGICHSLKPFGPLNIGERSVLELPTLKHLKTPIYVDLLQQPSFDALVRALHPTPALGVYPRQRGWEWLAQYNGMIERNRYGAPVGVYHLHAMRCTVAIRNVQWDKQGMRIGAGCGVIAESLCDQEWKEICLKIQAIREILAL